MKNKDHLHDELKEQAPFLLELKKHPDGYRAPEGYFDNLEDDVYRSLEAIGAKRRPVAPPARPSLWQLLQQLWQPRLALAAAGMLAVALAAWWYFQTPPSANTLEQAAAQLSAEDAEAYLLDNLMRLDPEQIAMVLPEENLPPISLENPAPGAGAKTPAKVDEIQLRPEDIESILNDMTDEELKDLML